MSAGEIKRTRLGDRPWACFRHADRIVNMIRAEHDAAVRAGERCGCGHCLDCRAREYWREAGLNAGVGEYPLDVEFDLLCICPGGPPIVDGMRVTYPGPRRGELLCDSCGGRWDGGT